MQIFPLNPDGTLNRQEVLDRAVAGLVAQGGPAFDPEMPGCRYLDVKANRRCAIGQFIPAELEGEVVEEVAVSELLRDYLRVDCPSEKDMRFLEELQNTHDSVAEQSDSDEEFFLELKNRLEVENKTWGLVLPEIQTQ